MRDARIDEQAAAETLDDDKLPDEFPPDRPLGAGDYGITPSEELVDEPLAERVAREEPEPVAGPDGDAEETVGPLVQPDQGAGRDDEPDAVASSAGADASPPEPNEEAAMHRTTDPPLHARDGYLEDSPGS